MSDDTRRRGLGRGLSALFGEAAADEVGRDAADAPREVPIEHLAPNPLQPRRRFDDAELERLADSIRAVGILQPLLVRRHEARGDRYEIIAGERRWRAAQRARLHRVPVVVRELGDAEILEAALIENIQREDLSPLEEAAAYRRLIDRFGHTQEALGEHVGKSRSHVANTLRLLGLPDPVKALLAEGALTAGHARALLVAADAVALAERVVAERLGVRDTERLVQGEAGEESAGQPRCARGRRARTRIRWHWSSTSPTALAWPCGYTPRRTRAARSGSPTPPSSSWTRSAAACAGASAFHDCCDRSRTRARPEKAAPTSHIVMPGLVPAIHVAPLHRVDWDSWMPGTSPAMTMGGIGGVYGSGSFASLDSIRSSETRLNPSHAPCPPNLNRTAMGLSRPSTSRRRTALTGVRGCPEQVRA